VPVGPGREAPVGAGVGGGGAATVSPIRVSPVRDEVAGTAAALDPASPPLVPAEPIPTYFEPPDLASATASAAGDSRDEPDEPPLPDEARARAAAAAEAPSVPIEAAPGAVLNVQFAQDAGRDRVVSAMRAFQALLRERPGQTPVVVHVPAPGGTAPMPLRGVAYDAELLAEVRRRVGDGVIELRLG
jgi:hypothetical protein